MGMIEQVVWCGEPLRAEVYFDDENVYTVETDDGSSTRWMQKVSFGLSEGNNKVNPLGVSTSNRVDLQIYDANDNLCPTNTSSPYYGKIVNGVKIKLFISYNGVEWEPYGVWYTTSWSGGYSDGGHTVVSVSAEDRINTVGNMDLPELPAYANVEVGDLIASVFTGIGIQPDEYTIDASINQSILYGVTTGGKVRDFLNNMCQLLFARVIVDRAGIIRFVPALDTYTTGNEIVLEGEYTGAFQSKNNNNINYNKLGVKYLVAGDVSRAQIFRDTTRSLVVGDNVISDITFRNKVLSIEQVECLFDSNGSSANVDKIHYEGYQNGMALMVTVSGEVIPECELRGEGIVVSTTEKVYTVDVDNASIVGGRTFEFDTKQMMTDYSAITIANKLKEYMSKISKTITMSGTALTPRLYIGDKLTVQNTGTQYDGVYKITGLDISFGENYELSCTMIRIN